MTTAATVWTPAIRKELRPLLPAWLATVAAILLVHLPTPHGDAGFEVVIDLALVSFFVGTAVVGALAIGHEYLYGTLGSLLAQPRERRDILLQKLAVLVPLEIAIGLLFRARVPGLRVPMLFWSVDVLPVVAAVTVAPWLTMLCKSAIAGAVFTVTLLGICWGVGILSQSLPFVLPYWTVGIFMGGEILLCLVGAVMSWRTFMHLEAVGGPGGESFVVEGRTSSAVVGTNHVARVRSRAWLVARKDLRLQLPSLVVALVYTVGSLVFAAVEPNAKEVSQALYGLAPLYIGLITLLIGAVSSAEERQLGTAEWQAMMPMAAASQWAIKVLVTVGTLAVLALAAPAVVLSVVPVTRVLVTRDAATASVLFSLPLVLIGMYTSSLSRNSLTAFMAAAPAAIAAWMGFVSFLRPPGPFGIAFLAQFGDTPWRWIYTSLAPHGLPKSAQAAFGSVIPAAAALIAIAPLLAAVYFAMRNHRSAERGARRILRQIAWMLTFVVIATYVMDGVAIGEYWDAPRARVVEMQVALRHVASGIDGDAGVCVLIRFRSACVDQDRLFPMAGTWRLPVVIAALKAIDSGALQPDASPDTLLGRALTDDGAASDLARMVSGTPVVDSFWFHDFTRGLLVRGDASHLQDITTPAKITWLLSQAGTPDGRLLSKAPTTRLRDLIAEAGLAGGGFRTGVPAGWTTWELSATTVDANGAPASTNDVGLLRAPDGTFITVAAFVSSSDASAAERTAFFANIARAIASAY